MTHGTQSQSVLHKGCLILILVSCFIAFDKHHAQESPQPFYPDGTYLEDVPTPDEVLGFPLGQKPARYDEAIRYLKILDEISPRGQLMETGETHEGRKLYIFLVTSEDNMEKLEEIRDNHAKLADPRRIRSNSEAESIIESNPAVVWLMYNVHGNELSGADASLQLAYQLTAGTDETTKNILQEVIVGIDPIENPDGRERTLAQLQQWKGYVPSTDVQNITHSGVWPGGRTNHYLFDMNRDWFILSQPESRARVKTILQWNPQLVVDAHEMGSFSTYFFNPPREPISLNIPPVILKWWEVFSTDQARAFDKYGWSYYTRESFDEWYPGYGSSWPYFMGSIAILYEQARTSGTHVKRPDGTVLSFREAIHHQFVSSLANARTAAENRKALLRDFYRTKQETISGPKKGDVQAYIINPGENPARTRRLIKKLLMQSIEVEMATKDFRMSDIRSYWNANTTTNTLPKGTYIIRMNQPMHRLIKAILEFDPRLTTKFLREERESLEKGRGTRMYEVGAWSMLLAYDVDAYVSTTRPSVETKSVTVLPESEGHVTEPNATYGFIIDYQDDHAVDALIHLLEHGYKVCSANKPFTIAGRSFSRGSLLLRIHENPKSLIEDIKNIARLSHAVIYGINTAMTDKGPDFGSQEFRLLTQPRLAVLTGPGINTSNFGALWYLLDCELKCKHTILDVTNLSRIDLRKYNVLILPSTWRGPEAYKQIFGKKELKSLKGWVADGGTLVAIGNGAVFLADTTTSFSKVRLRRQVLKDLEQYKAAYEQEKNIGKTKIDSLAIWEGADTSNPDEKQKETPKVDVKALKTLDEKQRVFMPRGTILSIDLNEEHWLNFGANQKVPAIVYTSYAFLSKRPVQTAARFSEGSHLRLSGLLWPEARARWEKSAYTTRESYEKGQLILFADEPNYRSYFYGTTRLLINSIFLGPGFGTSQPVMD